MNKLNTKVVIVVIALLILPFTATASTNDSSGTDVMMQMIFGLPVLFAVIIFSVRHCEVRSNLYRVLARLLRRKYLLAMTMASVAFNFRNS